MINYKKSILLEQENLLNQKDFNQYKELLIDNASNEKELLFLRNEEKIRFFFQESELKNNQQSTCGWQIVYMNKKDMWIANLIFSVYCKKDGILKKQVGSLVAQWEVAEIQKVTGDVYLNLSQQAMQVNINMELKIITDCMKTLIIRINHGLKITSIKQEDKVLQFNYIDDGRNGFEILFNQEYVYGDEIILNIEYSGQPILRCPSYINEKGALIWSEAMIFPILNFFPKDKYLCKVIFHYKGKFNLVSCGTLNEESVNDLDHISVWESDVPIMGLSFSIGDYQRVAQSIQGIKFSIFCREEDRYRIDKIVNTVESAIIFYSRIMDSAPYNTINICFDPLMDICCINSNLIYLYRIDDLAISHELAHMWWGMCVTGNGIGWLWFHEAFAQFFSDLFLFSRSGKRMLPEESIEICQSSKVEFDAKMLLSTYFGQLDDEYLKVLKKIVSDMGIENYYKLCNEIYKEYYFKSITFKQLIKKLGVRYNEE